MELLDYSSIATLERDKDAEEAVNSGLESMQSLVHLLSQHHMQQNTQNTLIKDCSIVADATISKFKKVVSLLSRTSGHARFRKAPSARSASLAHLTDFSLMEALTSCSSVDVNGFDSKRGSVSPPEGQALEVMPLSRARQVRADTAMDILGQHQLGDTSLGHVNTHMPLRHAHVRMPNGHTHMRAADAAEDAVHGLAHINRVPKAIFNMNEAARNLQWFTSSFPRQSIAHADLNSCLMQATAMHTDSRVSLSDPIPAYEATPLSSYPPQDFSLQSSSRVKPFEMGLQAHHMESSYGKGTTYSQYEHSVSSTPPPSRTTGSFLSSLSMDGSVTNEKNPFLQQAFGGSRATFSTAKRKCPGGKDEVGRKCHSSGGNCHCSKRRKSKIRRVVKVASVSSKMADIPTDEFSWRKYGQKPIKGSPHPRGYYKCSTVRGCLARKHVERDVDDANMLIVTYEGEHNHTKVPSGTATAL